MLGAKVSLVWQPQHKLREMHQRTVRGLFKASAAVRTTSRRRIRRRTKTIKRSKPGQSPRGHTGALRNNINFWVDRDAETAVIAPAILKKGGSGVDALEVGGTSYYGEGGPMEARPFMEPAFRSSQDTIKKIWESI